VRPVDSLRYVYPDIVVVCGDPIFEGDRTDIITNPTLIIEVLSDSTEATDRGAKWEGYQRIPSLREYVLIAQDRPSVEQYVRQGNLWIYIRSDALDAIVTFGGVGLALPLATIYEGVTMTDPDEITT
jgi:Uma2 family endonuclease